MQSVLTLIRRQPINTLQRRSRRAVKQNADAFETNRHARLNSEGRGFRLLMATLIHNPRTGPLLTGEAISFFAARSLDLPDRDVVETREVQVVADERACQLLELVEVVVELELAHVGVQVGETSLVGQPDQVVPNGTASRTGRRQSS